jgi:hypothetical protein
VPVFPTILVDFARILPPYFLLSIERGAGNKFQKLKFAPDFPAILGDFPYILGELKFSNFKTFPSA